MGVQTCQMNSLKLIVPFLLSVFMFGCVGSGSENQNAENKTGQITEEPTTPVRDQQPPLLMIKEFLLDNAGSEVLLKHTTFSTSGNKLSELHFSTEKPGEPARRILFNHNSDRQLTQETILSDDQKQISTFSYDRTGRVIRKLVINEQQKGHHEMYRYDENGDLRNTKWLDHKGKFLRQETFVRELNRDGYLKGETLKLENEAGEFVEVLEGRNFKYDKVGNKTREVTLSPDGKTRSIMEFQYDQDGQLTQRVEKDDEEKVILTENYTYNQFGEISKLKSENAEGTVANQTFEFDEYGNVVAETTERNGQVIETKKWTYQFQE